VRRFRIIDHTGDTGVVVYGKSIAELFGHAAEAFFELITEPGKIRESEFREISVEADELEELLVAWLNEFLYLFDTQGLLFRGFEIVHLDGRRLEATARGEAYDEGRHPIKTLIKAVTYHQLEIRQEKGIWKARIIFDL
jgi:SHS2 domain-containing protein